MLPVAQVAVDVSLPHLDRPFEYLVPEALSEAATVGCRVRVRFAGRLTSGFLLSRTAEAEHEGRLGYLERVVSPELVLTPEVAGLARAVADRYGGTLADVLRLAIPPRHAAVEAATRKPAPPAVPPAAAPDQAEGTAQPDEPVASASHRDGDLAGEAAVPPGSWARYAAGPSFLTALAGGRSPRAIWSALPGGTWAAEIATAAAAAASSGRGVVIVVPDARDLELTDAALTAALTPALGPAAHVVLSASLGPAERYRRWLAVVRGQVKVVAGTRSAMFAPVADLGLVVLWDEGDDLLAEPRAPYPHAREVLALRAHRAGAAALIGGFARTAEAAQLVAGGWARSLAAERATVRRFAPAVAAAGDDFELARDEAARSARLPSLALRTAREALAAGPVLFQAPRRGYLAALACERCHAPRRCRQCGGPGPADGIAGAADLRLVRGPGHRAVPAVRAPRAARPGDRGDPHGRGAGPGVPGRSGAHLGGQPGAGQRAERAGGGGRDAGRGAQRRRRLRGGGAAGRLGAAGPGQPAGGGGGGAAVDERGGAGPARARRAAGWSWWPTRACPPSRRWSAGIRRRSPTVNWRSAASCGSRRRAGWPRCPGRTTRSGPCWTAPTCRRGPRCWGRCRSTRQAGRPAAAGGAGRQSGPFPGPRAQLRGRRAGGWPARRTGRADGEKGAGSGPAGA